MTDPVIFGYTIFCDDVRFEVGDKISLIGVYHAVMLIPGEFPFTVPKFTMAVRYVERIGACSEEVRLRVFMPGDAEDRPTVDGKIEIEEQREIAIRAMKKIPNKDEPPEYIHIGSNIVLAPLVLQKPGLIRVRAFCGDETVKLGALRIQRASTEVQEPT